MVVLVRVTTAMMKYKTKSKWAYSAYISKSMFIIKGGHDRNSSRTGTSRQELIKKPHGGVLLTVLLLLLAQPCFPVPRVSSSEMTPPIMSWAMPYQSLIKRMSYMAVYSPILMESLFN